MPDKYVSHKVIISIGSNASDCKQRVTEALRWLLPLLSEASFAGPYLSDPEGDNGGIQPYANAVVIGNCELVQEILINEFHIYENNHGRVRTNPQNATITIDIDLVVYDDIILRPKQMATNYFQRGFLIASNSCDKSSRCL